MGLTDMQTLIEKMQIYKGLTSYKTQFFAHFGKKYENKLILRHKIKKKKKFIVIQVIFILHSYEGREKQIIYKYRR